MVEVHEVDVEYTPQVRAEIAVAKKVSIQQWYEKRIAIRRDALAWYSEQAAKGITSWGEGFDMWFARVPLTEREMDRKSDEAERWYEQEVAKRRLEAAAASNKHSHYPRIRFVLYSDLRLLQ